MNYLLDTHVLLWAQTAPDKLSSAALPVLTEVAKQDNLYLSVISVWEICKLVERGRLSLGMDTRRWLHQALEFQGLEVLPLSIDIALEATNLPQPFHNDPADQIIVATARVQNATLLTADRLILDYPHVKTLW